MHLESTLHIVRKRKILHTVTSPTTGRETRPTEGIAAATTLQVYSNLAVINNNYAVLFHGREKKVALVALRSGAFPSGVWLWINPRSRSESTNLSTRSSCSNHVVPFGYREDEFDVHFFSYSIPAFMDQGTFLHTHTHGILDFEVSWRPFMTMKGRCLWVCIYVCAEITSIICCYQHDTWWRWCWLYCVATGESSGMKVRRLVFMLFLCCKREKSFVLSRYRNRCSSVALWKGCLSRET